MAVKNVWELESSIAETADFKQKLLEVQLSFNDFSET